MSDVVHAVKARAIAVGVVPVIVMVAAGCATAREQRVSTAPSTPAFERGVAMYFGFDYDAAIRSFELAAREHPAAALPHWGEASEVERQFIEAWKNADTVLTLEGL